MVAHFPSPILRAPPHRRPLACVRRNFALCYRACVRLSHTESSRHQTGTATNISSSGGADATLSTPRPHRWLLAPRVFIFLSRGLPAEHSRRPSDYFGRGDPRARRCLASDQIVHLEPRSCAPHPDERRAMERGGPAAASASVAGCRGSRLPG